MKVVSLHLACCRSNPSRYSPRNRTIQVFRNFARCADLVDSVGERVFNHDSSGEGKYLDAHSYGSMEVNGSRWDFNLGTDVSVVYPFAKSYYENLSPDEFLVSEEKLKKPKYQAFAKSLGHALIPFSIGNTVLLLDGYG